MAAPRISGGSVTDDPSRGELRIRMTITRVVMISPSGGSRPVTVGNISSTVIVDPELIFSSPDGVSSTISADLISQFNVNPVTAWQRARRLVKFALRIIRGGCLRFPFFMNIVLETLPDPPSPLPEPPSPQRLPASVHPPPLPPPPTHFRHHPPRQTDFPPPPPPILSRPPPPPILSRLPSPPPPPPPQPSQAGYLLATMEVLIEMEFGRLGLGPPLEAIQALVDSIYHRYYYEISERESAFSAAAIAAAGNISTGLSAIEISNLKTEKFDGNTNGELCSVCLAEYKEGDVITPLEPSCSHIFHNECVVKWLRKNRRCPLCRSQVVINHN
ncbi:unnamed protein product [Cuscuta epithymum]|uniref:RING-type domain-containing protein n=1 Tax=Cuscuta epithymum TaxID=186058 RepID=A0AAV0GBN2_9ASTE|nr:unnamed protein product [Cuscuta epithymum]